MAASRQSSRLENGAVYYVTNPYGGRKWSSPLHIEDAKAKTPTDATHPPGAILFSPSHRSHRGTHRPNRAGFNSAYSRPGGGGAVSALTLVQANCLRRHPGSRAGLHSSRWSPLLPQLFCCWYPR